jgi:hypothetical protein
MTASPQQIIQPRIQRVLVSPVSKVLVSEVIGESSVNNHVHALFLDAGFDIPQRQAVVCFLAILSILQHEVYPFLPLIQVAGSALEFHSLDVRHRLPALLHGDPKRDRLYTLVDRLHLNQLETASVKKAVTGL